MTALDNLRSDLAYAQALRLALEANALKLEDPGAQRAATARASAVYRLNAAHANRIYHRAVGDDAREAVA